MDRYKSTLENYYYDAAKYPTYLDQLGINYPQLIEPNKNSEE